MQKHHGRTTQRKTKRGNVFANGLRYFQALNTMYDADDDERMTRAEMRKQARTWRLRTKDGRKKGTVRSR